MAVTGILGALCVIFALLFIYPYALYPLLLRLLRSRSIAMAPVRLPVSILFCAFNEAECLPAKIANLRALKRAVPDVEILVYDDSSSDGSDALLAAAGDVLRVVRGPGRTGKAAGMKRLVAEARGEVLIFTDANILLAPDLVDRLLPYYGDPAIGGVAGTIRAADRPESVTGAVGTAFLSLDDRLQLLESRSGNVMGASGGLFSVRRELYPDFPDTVQDDFTVSMSVIFQGKRLVKAPDVLAFERSVERRDEELARKIRIGARAFHTHRFLRPRLALMSPTDRVKYVSRKMLRWFGGASLVMACLCGLAAVATVSPGAAAAAAAATALITAVALHARRGILARLGEMGLAIFATLLGILQGMRGRTLATWNPAKSR